MNFTREEIKNIVSHAEQNYSSQRIIKKGTQEASTYSPQEFYLTETSFEEAQKAQAPLR